MINRYNSNNRATLDADAIMRRAPSVFATQAIANASDKYEFIPTTAILKSLVDNGWNCVGAQELRVRKEAKIGFQKHELRFTRPDLLMPDGSSIDIVYQNSHDLSQASVMSAAFWRKVCANGLHVSMDLVEPIRVKHIGSNARDFIEASFRLIDSVPVITESVQAMQAVELKADERMFLAQASLIAKYGAPSEDNVLPINAGTALMPRRYDDKKADLWTTFNVIQENLIHGGQRSYGVGQRRRTRAVTSLTENTKLNQALWTLAESMKRIKTA